MPRVLIIDDTKNIRVLLTQCLAFEGYEVSTASGGAEALRQIAEHPFDLIFLDVRMPEISGTEVLRHIRQMGINTPVVMMTAFGTVKNAVDCTQLGAVAYLQKPFTENKIRQVLEEVLQTKPERQSVDSILHLAAEQIKSSRFGDAEQLLKSALSSYFVEPRVYSLLAEAYTGLGREQEAEKCKKIADALGFHAASGTK